MEGVEKRKGDTKRDTCIRVVVYWDMTCHVYTVVVRLF